MKGQHCSNSSHCCLDYIHAVNGNAYLSPLIFDSSPPLSFCSAEHFQLLLKKYPAQTSSRVSASQWACAIHNKVNERLGKEIFNCADIEQKYQCGCEEDPLDTLIATTASMKDE